MRARGSAGALWRAHLGENRHLIVFPCLNDLFRCHHKMGPFGQLLTMVAAALVPFHVSFRLPEADRKALVGTGVYEKKQTQEALLLLKFRQEHLAHDSNGLVQLTRLCMTAHDPCVPGLARLRHLLNLDLVDFLRRWRR